MRSRVFVVVVFVALALAHVACGVELLAMDGDRSVTVDGFKAMLSLHGFETETIGAAAVLDPTAIGIADVTSFIVIPLPERKLVVGAAVSNLQGRLAVLAGKADEGVAVDGTGTFAQFAKPVAVAHSADGSAVYVVDQDAHAIRKIVHTSNTWVVTTFCGSLGARGAVDGACADATFDLPTGIAVGADAMYVSDAGSGSVRIITTGATPHVTTLAPVGPALKAPGPLALSLDHRTLFVSDTGTVIAISAIDTGVPVATFLAGSTIGDPTDGTGSNAVLNALALAQRDAGSIEFEENCGPDITVIRKIDLADNSVTGVVGSTGTLYPECIPPTPAVAADIDPVLVVSFGPSRLESMYSSTLRVERFSNTIHFNAGLLVIFPTGEPVDADPASDSKAVYEDVDVWIFDSDGEALLDIDVNLELDADAKTARLYQVTETMTYATSDTDTVAFMSKYSKSKEQFVDVTFPVPTITGVKPFASTLIPYDGTVDFDETVIELRAVIDASGWRTKWATVMGAPVVAVYTADDYEDLHIFHPGPMIRILGTIDSGVLQKRWRGDVDVSGLAFQLDLDVVGVEEPPPSSSIDDDIIVASRDIGTTVDPLDNGKVSDDGVGFYGFAKSYVTATIAIEGAGVESIDTEFPIGLSLSESGSPSLLAVSEPHVSDEYVLTPSSVELSSYASELSKRKPRAGLAVAVDAEIANADAIRTDSITENAPTAGDFTLATPYSGKSFLMLETATLTSISTTSGEYRPPPGVAPVAVVFSGTFTKGMAYVRSMGGDDDDSDVTVPSRFGKKWGTPYELAGVPFVITVDLGMPTEVLVDGLSRYRSAYARVTVADGEFEVYVPVRCQFSATDASCGVLDWKAVTGVSASIAVTDPDMVTADSIAAGAPDDGFFKVVFFSQDGLTMVGARADVTEVSTIALPARVAAAPAVGALVPIDVFCGSIHPHGASSVITGQCTGASASLIAALDVSDPSSTIRSPLEITGAVLIRALSALAISSDVVVRGTMAVGAGSSIMVRDGGSLTLGALNLDPEATYVVGPLNPVTVDGEAALGGTAVLDAGSSKVAAGDTFVLIRFLSSTGEFVEAFLAISPVGRSRRSVLQGVPSTLAVLCTANQCTGTAVSGPGADDDDEVPIVVALIVVAAALFVAIVALVVAISKRRRGNKPIHKLAVASSAPAVSSGSYSSGVSDPEAFAEGSWFGAMTGTSAMSAPTPSDTSSSIADLSSSSSSDSSDSDE